MSEQSSPILKKGFLFWCLPALGAVFFIWLFQSVLLPFVIGIALAYLLNPVVNALHKAVYCGSTGGARFCRAFYYQ